MSSPSVNSNIGLLGGTVGARQAASLISLAPGSLPNPNAPADMSEKPVGVGIAVAIGLGVGLPLAIIVLFLRTG